MDLNWNMIFNGACMLGVQLFLAMEGLKSIFELWSVRIKGKAAFFTFLGFAAVALIESSGMPRPEMYAFNTLLRILSVIGIYEVFSRLLKAIERR